MTPQLKLSSLGELCSQKIVIYFWRDPANKRLYRVKAPLDEDKHAHMTLNSWISKLKLPKTLKEQLAEVGIALGRALHGLFHEYDLSLLQFLMSLGDMTGKHRELPSAKRLHNVRNFFDMLALSATGGIDVELTLQRILQSPQTKSGTKCRLALHFCISDQNVSDNHFDYVEKLAMAEKFVLYQDEWKTNDASMSEFMRALKEMNVWKVKYYWNKMDEAGRTQIADRLNEIILILRYDFKTNMSFDNGTNTFPIVAFLIDSLPEQKQALLLAFFSYRYYVVNLRFLMNSIRKFVTRCFHNPLKEFQGNLEGLPSAELRRMLLLCYRLCVVSVLPRHWQVPSGF